VGLEILPFIHSVSNRHIVLIDVNNIHNKGPTALISMGGGDRSINQFIAPSIESFLSQHLDKLSTDWYFSTRGELEMFPANPLNNKGSVTVTNGVKVEACG
jgi:hypothetical protein